LSKKVQKSHQRNSWMKKLEDKRMTTTLKKNKKLLFELFTWKKPLNGMKISSHFNANLEISKNADETWVLYIQDKSDKMILKI
jgi:hypothetical protein